MPCLNIMLHDYEEYLNARKIIFPLTETNYHGTYFAQNLNNVEKL